MSRLNATIGDLDVALTLQRSWESESLETGFAGSTHWCRAAAKVLPREEFVPVTFMDQHRQPVGVLILVEGKTDWRTGTPGLATLRWPFQEFGYHFGPTWAPDIDDRQHDWVVALWELFPDRHFELHRCAPVTRACPDVLCASDGPPTWSTAVAGSVDQWQARLEGEHRRDFEYYRRRIEKSGGEWHDADPTTDLGPALAECFDLHARRVAAKATTSAYLSDHGRAFLTALVEVNPSAVRISRLLFEGRTIGSNLSFVHDGHYQCFMPGWDQEGRKFDLGRQVIYHQILAEFARGLSAIDLLGGDLAYKKEFGLLPVPTTDLVTRRTGAAAARKKLVDGALHLYRRIKRT